MRRYMLFVRTELRDDYRPVGSIARNAFHNRLWDTRGALWDALIEHGVLARSKFAVSMTYMDEHIRSAFVAGNETDADENGNIWIALAVDIQPRTDREVTDVR